MVIGKSGRPLPCKLEVFFWETFVVVVKPLSDFLQSNLNEQYSHMQIGDTYLCSLLLSKWCVIRAKAIDLTQCLANNLYSDVPVTILKLVEVFLQDPLVVWPNHKASIHTLVIAS